MPIPFPTIGARFKHALRGVRVLVRGQRNARIHLTAAVLVVVMGMFWAIRPGEWLALVLAIGGVWTAEALNTGIELLADAVHPDQHALIRDAKDVAAAGVLVMAACAVVMGLIVFVPYVCGR